MIRKTTKKVLKKIEEVDSEVVICDVCKKEIHYTELSSMGPVGRYYKIKTGHYDWGNDSCDSIEYEDACCDECLSKYTQKWLKNADVVKSKTAYIEIHKATHLRKG